MTNKKKPAVAAKDAAGFAEPERLFDGHVVRHGLDAVAEEILFALAHEMLTHLDVGAVETVFVDHHGLQFLPVFPGFFTHLGPDALAEFARHRRKIETFGVFFELNAVNGACQNISFS